MRLHSILFRLTAVCCLLAASDLSVMAGDDLRLWYDSPAGDWNAALPIGNGHGGAMIFGRTETERVQFNEDTVWAAKPDDYINPNASPELLAEVRKTLFAGDQAKATQMAAGLMSDPLRQRPYQPFGDVNLEFNHKDVTDYRRWLDLSNATAGVSYIHEGVTYTREYLASYPNRVIAIELSADQPGKLSFTMSLTTPHDVNYIEAIPSPNAGGSKAGTIFLRGKVKDFAGRGGKSESTIKLECRAGMIQQGGTLATKDNNLVVEGADRATILIYTGTSYVNYADTSADPNQVLNAIMADKSGKSYQEIREAHIADYRQLFDRCTLKLGEAPATDLPTDDRILANADKPDPGLEALAFQFGRYLMIASSRPGSQPANLQGVWNESMTPPWESKYTTNINTEMNYWVTELTNLSECGKPLFSMIDDLTVTGSKVAREHYGMPGWVFHHNTDGWRGAAAINSPTHGIWPVGGAWLCQHLWWHYQFTGDEKFLADRAYPAMKSSCEFFLAWLIEDPKFDQGWLVSGPSNSPERGGLVMAPTMDHQILRYLFENTARAADLLEVDAEFAKQLRTTAARIAPNQIGSEKQLKEWLYKEEPKTTHRHVSHLWGLHPGEEITPQSTPELADACRRTLELRGDGGTCWSMAWKVNFWARLLDGDHAHLMTGNFLKLSRSPKTGHKGGGVYTNLLACHPPYQIDGNFGFTSGVAEMLVQSHRRTDEGATIIDILPALPKAWPSGEVTGLCARGGFEVSIRWSHGNAMEVEVNSKLGNPAVVVITGTKYELRPEKGKTVIVPE